MKPFAPELSGVVAVVTGGGRGFGRVVATTLADPGAVSSGVRAVEDALGPIDLLVNNAGVNGPVGPGWDVDVDSWWRTLEVNLRGVMLCSAAVLPSMVERGVGRLVNVVSHAGVFRWPLVSAYSVSKAAVVKFTENQAQELRRCGVTAFAVHPGLLRIGSPEQFVGRTVPKGSYEAKIVAWADKQRDVSPALGAELIARIAAGEDDSLSGCHLRADEDLGPLLADAEDIVAQDSRVLRIRD